MNGNGNGNGNGKEDYLRARGWVQSEFMLGIPEYIAAWCWRDPRNRSAYYRVNDAYDLERSRESHPRRTKKG